MKKLYLLLFLLPFLCNAQMHSNWSSNNIFKTDYFIENKGQYKGNEKIEYGVENGNDNISFTHTGFIYHLQKSNNDTEAIIIKNDITCKWLNTNPNCTIIAEQKSNHYFTYGNFMAYGYKKITYKNLYKGIDLEYTLHPKSGIKYSLIIQPNTDIRQLQFEYTINGKPAIIELSNNELRIKNNIADIIETGLTAQDATGKPIAFNYAIENNKVSLIAPKKMYSSVILIDPWVTPLTTLIGLPAASNKGFDVDYDTTGNLYVYGGGGGPLTLGPYKSKIAKYNRQGVLQWTFMGYITASKMTTQVQSNFCTSKLDGKSYCMVDDTLISRFFYSRLTTIGTYDNFSSIALTQPIGWTDFRINCGTGGLYGLGYGTSTNSNFVVVDTTTGNATFTNITQLPQNLQFGVCLTLNSIGECFVIFNCGVNIFGQVIPPSAPAFIHNRIYKLNAGFNSFIWNAHSGYNSFSSQNNKRKFVLPAFSNQIKSNGFNCLAANNQYLFYYDGFHIKAFNSSNGAVAGNADSVIGQQPLYSGGIYANACNEVFVGGVGGYVLKYKFNGNNFTLIDTLHIAGMQGKATYDIMCNPSNNMLYVSGDSFVAVLNPNSNCIDTSNLKLNITACANKIILETTIRDSTCSHQFIWYDTTAHIVVRSIIKSSGHFADTLYAPNTAHVYLASITKLSACQIVKQSQYVHLFNPTFHFYKSATICFGGSYTLPSGIIVNAAGIYHDTLATHTGCDSIITTALSIGSTYHFYNSISICSNQHYILPNGMSVNTSGIYHDTLLTYVGCDSIITTQLSVKSISQNNFSATICQGNIYTLPDGQHVSAAGIYNSVLTNYVGCDSIISTQLNVIQNSSSNQTLQACVGDSIILPDGKIAKYGGNYFSTLKNYKNCDSIIHTVVWMYEKPLVNLGNDTSFCEGNSIELDAGDNKNSTLNKYYSWNVNTNSNQQRIVVTASGLYLVQVSSPPCKTVSDEINIQVKNCECKLIMPNSFTPNADGIDDDFKLFYDCTSQPTNWDFKIYNRLGQKVFYSTLYQEAWNGTFNGALQEVGTYVFFVSFINPTTQQKEFYKGDVILLR